MNGESGPGYQTGNMSEQGDEPGAVSNRLSLDPNDDRWADTVGEWKDGQEYTLTVKVRQISPGEFEVDEAIPKAGSDAAEPAGDEDNAPSPGANYPNPAVASLSAG